MKRWVLLLLSVICISSARAADMGKIVAGVEERLGLNVMEAPVLQNDDERLQHYQRSLQIAAAYMQEGYANDALRKFIYAYRIMPDQEEALFMIGTILISLKDYEDCVAIFEDLAKRYPDDYRMNNNLGWIYCTADDPKFRDGRKAERYASKALIYAPNDYHVWSTLAEARYVYGNYKAAERAARQALMLAKGQVAADSAELRGYEELLDKCKRALAAESGALEKVD